MPADSRMPIDHHPTGTCPRCQHAAAAHTDSPACRECGRCTLDPLCAQCGQLATKHDMRLERCCPDCTHRGRVTRR